MTQRLFSEKKNDLPHFRSIFKVSHGKIWINIAMYICLSLYTIQWQILSRRGLQLLPLGHGSGLIAVVATTFFFAEEKYQVGNYLCAIVRNAAWISFLWKLPFCLCTLKPWKLKCSFAAIKIGPDVLAGKKNFLCCSSYYHIHCCFLYVFLCVLCCLFCG